MKRPLLELLGVVVVVAIFTSVMYRQTYSLEGCWASSPGQEITMELHPNGTAVFPKVGAQVDWKVSHKRGSRFELEIGGYGLNGRWVDSDTIELEWVMDSDRWTMRRVSTSARNT